MPAVRVKTEQIEIRTLNNNDRAFERNPDHPRPRHALDHSERIRTDALALGPSNYHQVPLPHPAVITQAIAQANHETLLETRNAVYLCALQEIYELRAIAAGYQQQVINLDRYILDWHNAYMQLLAQIQASQCQTCLQVQGGPMQGPEVPEIPPSFPPLAFGLPVATPCPGTAPLPPAHEFYGPVPFPGGFQVMPHVGHWITTPDTRPSDLPFDVFWEKADWLGTGYGDGAYVTDREGNCLIHLMKGIRKAARRIWTELARRPGASVASTFKKNSSAFINDYANAIEAIYPCLALCSSHWKAKQIGMSAYGHWYKYRNKYLGRE